MALEFIEADDIDTYIFELDGEIIIEVWTGHDSGWHTMAYNKDRNRGPQHRMAAISDEDALTAIRMAQLLHIANP